jgi:hypothetical protein
VSWLPEPPEDGPTGLGDAVAQPGSLGIKERRSWPTSALVTGALLAGALGAMIGYLSDRAAPSSGPTGPSFPSVTSQPTTTGTSTAAHPTGRGTTSGDGADRAQTKTGG